MPTTTLTNGAHLGASIEGGIGKTGLHGITREEGTLEDGIPTGKQQVTDPITLPTYEAWLRLNVGYALGRARFGGIGKVGLVGHGSKNTLSWNPMALVDCSGVAEGDICAAETATDTAIGTYMGGRELPAWALAAYFQYHITEGVTLGTDFGVQGGVININNDVIDPDFETSTVYTPRKGMIYPAGKSQPWALDQVRYTSAMLDPRVTLALSERLSVDAGVKILLGLGGEARLEQVDFANNKLMGEYETSNITVTDATVHGGLTYHFGVPARYSPAPEVEAPVPPPPRSQRSRYY